jgi:hypothetical protein
MSWFFRRSAVASSAVIVKFFVMFKTGDGAFYTCYLKNTGSTGIDNATCTVQSKQPMKQMVGDWVIANDTAVCNLGPLQVGEERAISLDIAGDDSSAILTTTTTPALADPGSGIAKASYHRVNDVPEVIAIGEMLTYARKL